MKFSTQSAGAIATASMMLLGSVVEAAWDLSQNKNTVVYWGQNAHGQWDPDTVEKQQKPLIEYCKNEAIDALVISFVNKWDSDGNISEINLSNACTGYTKFIGTELLWCPTISADIIACQKQYGKKILLGLGGGAGDYTGFSTDAAADNFAQNLWDQFGKGWSYYRPFGNAVVDGFDFDIELGEPTGYARAITKLRSFMNVDKALPNGKNWLVTAAPQCRWPDAKLHDALVNSELDAIFIQFYNNPSCAVSNWQLNVGTGFNFGHWDWSVRQVSKNRNVKIFLGIPMSPKVAASGYVARGFAQDVIRDLQRFPQFAGVMAWDASENAHNAGYLESLKALMLSLPGRRVSRSLGDMFKRRSLW